MSHDNQPVDFSLPTKFTAKRAAEVARRKKLQAGGTAQQEEKPTSIKKKTEAPHAEDTKTQIKSAPVDKKTPIIARSEAMIEKNPRNDKKKEEKKELRESAVAERSEMSIQRELTAIEEVKKANTKDELATILIDYLTSIFERGALLLITKTHIIGWQGGGEGIHKNITHVNIPLELESVFKHVIENKRYYSGMWNPQKGDYLFYESLEITRSDDIIVVPVILNDKVFVLFYTDNYKVNPHHITPSSVEVPGLVNVAREFSKSFLRVMKK